jgi:peroxiredoxin
MQTNNTFMRLLWIIVFMGGVIASTGLSAGVISGNAPDFTLKSSNGENIKLSELRGQVVLINFWASWCGPCRQEMPELNKLYEKYKKLGFIILGVNVEEDETAALRIIEEDKIGFPVLFDSENKVSKLYNVDAMPTTVLVARNGSMRYLHRAYKPGDIDEYIMWVKKLIRE